LPRQQQNLALISEFIVQMLYLTGLKNVVDDFLSCPHSLEPPGTDAAAAAADSVDFKAMVAKQNHCVEIQRLLGGSSLKIAFRQAPRAWLVMFQLAISVPLSQQNLKKTYFAFAQYLTSWEVRLPESCFF
jgi:hypothetical protein